MGKGMLNVLIADDHEKMRECLVEILRSEFTVVGAVSDGYELIEAAIQLKPDVIVTDISMPRLNGTEAVRNLRDGGTDIPVVFVSSDHGLVKHLERNLDICVHKFEVGSKLVEAVVRAAASRVRLGVA